MPSGHRLWTGRWLVRVFQIRRWYCRFVGQLDQIKRFMNGDFKIGSGASQRGPRRSVFCNNFKVSEYGREEAISRFAEHLKKTPELRRRLWTLSGLRLVCHCRPDQQCHGDSIIAEFKTQFPTAYDRVDPASQPPDSKTLNYLAVLREEPFSDEGSTADEGASPAGSGWRGGGRPMMVGAGHTTREICDGQSLASSGRWPPEARNNTTSARWASVKSVFVREACRVGTPELFWCM